MKRVASVLCLMGLCLFFSACAVGPLVNHESARTVGKSNSEVAGGYGNAGYVFKWNYGLTDNLDFGVHWESLSIGVRAKYAFVSSSAGWSFAGALGIGESIGGSHYYGDLIGSYKSNSWEPYGAIRIVHVKNDPVEVKDEDTGVVDFTVSLGEYNYGQAIVGSRYWLDPHWILSVEASKLIALTDGLEFTDGVIVGAAFGYRF